jgi:hypothetical protein
MVSPALQFAAVRRLAVPTASSRRSVKDFCSRAMVESLPTGHVLGTASRARGLHLSFGRKYTFSGMLDQFGESCSKVPASVCCNGDWREAVVPYPPKSSNRPPKCYCPRLW